MERPERSEFDSVDPAPPSDENNIESLRKSLCDEDERMFLRMRALFSLRNIGGKRSVEALAAAFQSDSALLKHEIAYVMGQMQDSTAVPYLIDRLEDYVEWMKDAHSMFANAKFEIKADMTIAADFTGDVARVQRIEDIKYDPSRAIHIRSLIPNGSTDSQIVRFPKESGYSDNASTKAEGSALGQSDFDITATSIQMEKIGTTMRLTEEMLDDTPQITSYLSARVPSKVLAIEDNQILNGNGSSPNLDGLFTDGGAFTTTSSGAFYQSVESANEFDVLVAALNQLAALNYQADSILLHPTDSVSYTHLTLPTIYSV